MDKTFFQSLDEKNHLVLTANRRLASYLHHQYGQYKIAEYKPVWQTPHILPLTTWLQNLWKKVDKKNLLLSLAQEQALWKKVSQHNWSTIVTIQQAWNILHNWDMGSKTQQHLQWANQFISECQDNHWLSTAEIPKELIALKSLKNYLPDYIFLLGFDDLTPIIKKLFEKIKNHCYIQIIKTPKLQSKIKRYEFDNKESELYQVAHWIFNQHQKDKTKKIACVIPNLVNIRQQVAQVFSEVFSDTIVFNIASGQRLNEFLIIKTALYALQEKWDNILQLPYLNLSNNDQELAAISDQVRRSKNIPFFDKHDLLTIFNSLHKKFPKSTFLARWKKLLLYQKTIPKLQLLSQWINTFTKILKLLAWPGSRTLDSTEYQVLHRWLKALEELAQCDQFYQKINYDTALSILKHHISQIIFQPKTKEMPIQILGILEASGLSFDILWIMGLDNETWPPPATPNPLLPYALQIQNNMPHASAERELDFTQQIMKRLLTSAKAVYLSSANKEGDCQLTPSPLISSIKTSAIIKKPEYFFTNNLTKLESINDNFGISIPKDKKITNGTSIIKYQALCPFKAYAHFRLFADILETPTIGLSSKLQGQLLHQILESIWKKIKTQDNLLKLNSNSCDLLISNIIENIIEQHNFYKLNERFLSVEKKRLFKIIKEWFSEEKKRSHFIVLDQEAECTVNINSLSFHCRIDRIDQLNNGGKIIIDYKSGLGDISIHDWFGPRPTEPQLPIYCIFGSEKIYDGIAFAKIQSGKMQFKGIVSEIIPEIKNTNIKNINNFNNTYKIKNWATLTQSWKTTLENLSASFSCGKAHLDPLLMRNKKIACDFCKLHSLCRVKECQS